MALEILTIGHSRHPWPRFLALLQAGGVELVADVRSAPRSRFSPHYNRETMKPALERVGIAYEWLGRELGGRPPEAEFYDSSGRVRYDLLAATDRFRQGLERAKLLAFDARVALLCSEEDPNACHRHLLVGRALAAEGVMLRHLRGDGRVQAESDLEAQAPDLFGV